MDQNVCWNKINCVLLHSWRGKRFWRFYSMVVMATSHSLWRLVFDSTEANNPCSFTKQYLIFKQAHLAGFCFVLFNKLKFWQLVLVFSALYRLYLEITLFCTKLSEQIVYCHVTDVKMLRFFQFIEQRDFSLILTKVEMLAWSQLVQM